MRSIDFCEKYRYCYGLPLNLIYRLLLHCNSITIYFLLLVIIHEYKTASVAGWTDHGSLTGNPIHISNILYVRTDSTDTSLKWKVNITIAEPTVAEAFTFLFSDNEDTVKMVDLGSNKIIFLDPTKPNDVYSFSAYNFRGSSKMIQVDVFHNEKTVHTVRSNNHSQKETAKSVRYSVEKLGGTSSIETKRSIVNIHGGKMYTV